LLDCARNVLSATRFYEHNSGNKWCERRTGFGITQPVQSHTCVGGISCCGRYSAKRDAQRVAQWVAADGEVVEATTIDFSSVGARPTKNTAVPRIARSASIGFRSTDM